MKKFFSAAGAILAFTIVFFASANVFATPILGPEVYIYFKGASDGIVKNITIPGYSGGVYAGLYSFKVDESKPYSESGATAWLSYCFDPWTNIHAGQSWVGYFNSPYNIGTGVGVLFEHSANDAEAIQKYNMIGYLAHKYFYNSDPAVDTKEERANLSLTLWEIAMDYTKDVPGSINLNSGSFRTSSAYGNAAIWLTDAYGYCNSGPMPFSYSDTGQEIFAPKPIPEPTTLILLFSGLAGLAGYGIRRKKKESS